ncbi:MULTISPECIES: exodeoxyribonuclease V subunit gamma [unclassified Thioalkalivibrio]|uniref:exodeoxyribonuclease V subunit gamma n=1 Tax=unclassified Thioalkalivibrio TaxID=2621013 RepID=UPI0004760209|nr:MULTISPECIES: exodeoxyribonuclease V subunit gamma [unclassified Thioalkalivibrio]
MVVLHGNHLESLRTLAVEWMRRAPLGPLENETILVQSNGMAQWLRHALAAPPDADPPGCGIAAALDMQLPSRFVWSAYRAVLGPEAVPLESPYAKRPLTWRLMRLLPECLAQDAFVPLRQFLQDDDPGQGGDLRKRFQLAERLADLFDQYQVYRADWLTDWAAGRDLLRDARGQEHELAPGQRWQAELWRLLQADIGVAQEGVSRSAVHARYMEMVRTLERRPPGLPRRIIVFGISSLPGQILEALEGLARFCQVLVCVHNPCAYYWADIVADKDLLRATRRRQARKAGMPEALDEAELHNHAHPLLAAWGKQGRDYIGLLDEHDDPEHYGRVLCTLDWERVDVFEPHGMRGPEDCLLHQLQEDIRELRPLAETRETWPAVPAADRSIQFHVAHSPLREVELLHDRLLDHFERDPALRPRDVIVMVPDIDQYAPHIEAVFGQPETDDPRFIPYTLSDQGPRGRDPVLIALEQLLSLPESRMGVSELLDLLDVPAVRRRFGIAEEDLGQLHHWAEGSGVRWGLDAAQRAGLGLPEGLEQNTWRFGLRRMLLGYALGDQGPWQGLEPYDEIGGLSAALLGPLEALITALEEAWGWLRQTRAPEDWATHLGGLLDKFFAAETDAELFTLEQLGEALDQWREDCAAAGLEEALPLAVVREQWLASQDDSGVGQRFLAGQVNFCTLMPMRAIPFQVVCLLGMNDGDYPRSPTPVDFDLMAQDYRPGDRSRREDDRYLFLEALLSARRQLHVSWVGRHVRDNEPRPPSVLVGQLRDHLAAGWGLTGFDGPEAGPALVDHLTTWHPLQPFSPVNFPAGGDDRHYTYAREWEAVHDPDPVPAADAAGAPEPVPLLDAEREPRAVAPEALTRFLRFPVEAFFRYRLGVFFDEEEAAGDDLEPFGLAGLEQWQVRQQLVAAALETTDDAAAWPEILEAESARLQRAGRLPLGAAGELERGAMVDEAARLLERIGERLALYPDRLKAGRPLRLEHAHWGLEAVPSALRSDGQARICLDYTASRIANGRKWRYDKLMAPWVMHLLANAGEGGVGSELVALDTRLTLPGLEPGLAEELLGTLLEAWAAGQERPLPLACGAAFAWLEAEEASKDPYDEAVKTLRGNDYAPGEWSRSPALARAWPDPETLLDDPDFGFWRDRVYRPVFFVVNQAESSE